MPNEIYGISVEDVIWTAGFFDGEGMVAISRLLGNGTFRLLVEIVQVQSPPVQPVFSMLLEFGGSIYSVPLSPGRQPKWRWQIGGRDAALFLRTIRPYLKFKREEVDIALEFFSWYSIAGARRGKRFGQGGSEPISAAVKQQATQYWEQLRQIRPRKGPSPHQQPV